MFIVNIENLFVEHLLMPYLRKIFDQMFIKNFDDKLFAIYKKLICNSIYT